MCEVVHQAEKIQEALVRVLTEGTDLKSLSIEHRLRLADELRKGLPPESQRMTFRYIIFGLCIVAIFPPVIYAILAPWLDQAHAQFISPVLQLSSTAIGALAAYLTGRRSGSTPG